MRETIYVSPNELDPQLATGLRRLLLWVTAHAEAFTTLAFFVGFLLLRLPLRSAYPANWDAVQMALGIQSFDIHHHQPHPPGYIGYIALGKVVNLAVHDPHASLTLICAVAGAFAPAMLYSLARRFMANWAALCTTIAFGTSLLVWYYSEVALTYAIELALLLPFLLFAHRALTHISRRDLLLATFILTMVGAFRQTAFVLLLPLWLWMLWRYPWRARLLSAGLLTAGVLTWLVPLLWLSGGPFSYLHESRQLAEITGGNTSVLSINPAGPAQNLGFVVAGLVLGVNIGLLALALGSRVLLRVMRRNRRDTIFFALWGLPALTVYLLGHVGQIGYILILLPIPYLWLGILLREVASSPRLRTRVPLPSTRQIGAILTVIFVAVNVAGFLALPKAVNRLVPHSLQPDVRQFDLKANDQHWHDLTRAIHSYPPDSTAILTTIGGPRVSGSYRHLAYLMPDYRVYGFGRDLETGAFAPLFRAHGGSNNYSIDGMYGVEPWLVLPADTRYVLIPDPEIVDRLYGDFTSYDMTLDNGSTVAVVIVDPETALAFSVQGEIITVLGCEASGRPCQAATSRAMP